MKATNAHTEMRSILTSFTTELDTANHFSDQDLNPQALTDRREALRSTAIETHVARARTLYETAVAAANKAAEAADAAAAALPRDNAAEGLEWKHAILPQLESGVAWGKLLPTLSADGLRAVERFGPAYVRSTAKSGGSTEIPGQVDQEVDALTIDVRTHLWDHIEKPAIADEARSTATVAEVVRHFANSLQHARRSSDLTAASTYLSTVENPSFGGEFAAGLTE